MQVGYLKFILSTLGIQILKWTDYFHTYQKVNYINFVTARFILKQKKRIENIFEEKFKKRINKNRI